MGSTAGGVNLYSYAGSNPVAYADPFGLFCAGTDFCFDEYGRLTKTINNNGLDHDRYFVTVRGKEFQLDWGLKPADTPYEFHLDPRDAMRLAEELASNAPIYKDWLTVSYQSTQGRLNFKRNEPLSEMTRSLWAIGGNRLAHVAAVGNMAWGYYMARVGFSLPATLSGASIQGRAADPRRGEDALDQIMITRGYIMFGR